MTIIYVCDNCKKKFKLKEFIKLEAISTPDDRCEDVHIVQKRKCDSCGKEIKTEDKVVESR